MMMMMMTTTTTIYSILKSFLAVLRQDTSVLDSRFVKLVVLPDDRLVRSETCTCGICGGCKCDRIITLIQMFAFTGWNCNSL